MAAARHANTQEFSIVHNAALRLSSAMRCFMRPIKRLHRYSASA
jgi:hypothetical protein